MHKYNDRETLSKRNKYSDAGDDDKIHQFSQLMKKHTPIPDSEQVRTG